MCAAWTIAADKKHNEITVNMGHCDALAISQGGNDLLVGPIQLEALAEKLFSLAQIYKADVHDAVEYLFQE